MCGIWSLFSIEKGNYDIDTLIKNFKNIDNRGPDFSVLKKIESIYNIYLGFARLSINGLGSDGNQPFEIESLYYKYYLICNGEIYNYLDLSIEYNIELKTSSDCEILLPLYIKLGMNRLIDKLDGVFAITIIRIDKSNNSILMESARDRIGVRPMFYGYMKNMRNIYVASEMKGIVELCDKVNVFPPGTIMKANIHNDKIKLDFHQYYDFSFKNTVLTDENDILSLIRIYFNKAIKKRLMSERPIGSLLSGGLDSSLVSALVAKFSRKRIKTFSISMAGGTDSKYADMVAKFIKSDHHNIELKKEEFLDAIEETIWAIESYDITTVRASVGQFLVSKYISENTDIKVVMSGDGSDELCSGYIYNFNAPSDKELHDEAKLRLKEIHLYDSLRADRATSCHGLELRVPFLDQDFVNMFMRIDPKLRKPDIKRMEKYLLRKAYETEDILPKEVLWRKKEAFSDGISSEEESWYTTLTKYIDNKISDKEFHTGKDKYSHCPPESKEAYYYRKIFCEKFNDKNSQVIPRFWLPKWCGDIKEPSARVLDVYNLEEEEEVEEVMEIIEEVMEVIEEEVV